MALRDDACAGRSGLAMLGCALSSRTQSHAAFLLLLALGVVLRVWGIGWGLPDPGHLFSYHPDEYHSLRGLFALLSGDPNPHFFNYGSLYLYLVASPALLLHEGLAAHITSGDAPHLALHIWTLDARVVTVLAGVASLGVVYALGARLCDRLCGLLAAALLAVMPLHVLHSHFATVDVTQGLFVAAALFFAVRIVQAGDWRSYAGAGLMVGLAASTKYNGAAAAIAPLVAHIAAVWGRRGAGTEPASPGQGARWAGAGLCLLLSVAVFAATSPYTFLAWDEAQRDIRFEIEHARVGEHPAMDADPSGALFHLRNLAWPGAGPTLLLAGAGVIVLLRRPRREAWPLLAFVGVWFLMISLSNTRYARYEVPLAPPLALLAACALGAWPPLARRRGLRALCFALAFSVSVVLSHGVSGGLSAHDPRAQALRAITAEARPAERIGLVQEPWFGVPPVDYCNGGTVIRRSPLWGRFKRPVRPLVITGLDAEALRRDRPEFFVLSEFDVRDGIRARWGPVPGFMDALAADYERIGEFGGAPRGLAPWPLGSDWSYAWPRIELFRRRGP